MPAQRWSAKSGMGIGAAGMRALARQPASPLRAQSYSYSFSGSRPLPRCCISQPQDLGLVTCEDGVAGGHAGGGGHDAVVVARHRHHRAAVVVVSAGRNGCGSSCGEAGGAGRRTGGPTEGSGGPAAAARACRAARCSPHLWIDDRASLRQPRGTHGDQVACCRTSAPAAGTWARTGSAAAISNQPAAAR